MEFIYSVQGSFYSEIKTSTLVFVEAVLQSYLYLQGLYPAEAFVSKILFGVNIKSVGENSLKEYINEFICAIEELNNKGILHSVSILIFHGDVLLEEFTVRVRWVMNVYGLNDNDKVLSVSDLEANFAVVLNDLYEHLRGRHEENFFRIIVETTKEEVLEDEEVLGREHWKIISKNLKSTEKNVCVQGVLSVDWG